MVKLENPSFSYQAIVLSSKEADKTSISPSLSTSSAKTINTVSASSVMVWEEKSACPSFSYQTILLSSADADNTSISESPSISIAYTYEAPCASIVIV